MTHRTGQANPRQHRSWFAIATLAVLAASLWCYATLDAQPSTSTAQGASPDTALPPPACDDTARTGDVQPAGWTQVVDRQGRAVRVELCQARCLVGVDCGTCQPCGEARWQDRHPIAWEMFSQGEYVGPYRDAHVPEYRLRVGDSLEFIYRLTRVESAQPYEWNVGDRIRVESLIDANLDRDLVIQPDGTITIHVQRNNAAFSRTFESADELKENAPKLYEQYLSFQEQIR